MISRRFAFVITELAILLTRMWQTGFPVDYRQPNVRLALFLVDFTSVTEVDLLSYRNHLQYSKRHKTATINQHVATLRSFFSFLYNNGFISESVITNLNPLSKPFLRAPEVPKRADILKLFRMVDTSNDRGNQDGAL